MLPPLDSGWDSYRQSSISQDWEEKTGRDLSPHGSTQSVSQYRHNFPVWSGIVRVAGSKGLAGAVWGQPRAERLVIWAHRKNPGNTKYVLDGHWFMEIDGNC